MMTGRRKKRPTPHFEVPFSDEHFEPPADAQPSDDDGISTSAERGEILVRRWMENLSPFDETYWPLGFAVNWIVWRDAEKAAQEWGELRASGHYVWRRRANEGAGQGSGWEASDELLTALKRGNVAVIGRKPGSEEITPIHAAQWMDLRFFDEEPLSAMDAAVRKQGVGVVYRSLQVARDEILNSWPAKSNSAEPQEAQPPPEAGVSPLGERVMSRGKRPDSKMGDVVRALRRLYPDGRPQTVDRAHMQKSVELAIGGRTVSFATLDRARAKAWPV